MKLERFPVSGFRSQVSSSAFLRGDPLQRAVFHSEDVGACGGRGGELELALGVSALAGGLLDEGRIDLESGEDEISHQVGRRELDRVAATSCRSSFNFGTKIDGKIHWATISNSLNRPKLLMFEEITPFSPKTLKGNGSSARVTEVRKV